MAKVGMNYLSGNCGLKVSNICLGTMVFGDYSKTQKYTVNYDETCQILDRYVALGGNFIDTANMYCVGQSEQFIGNWLSGQERDKLVIASKCRFQPGDADGLSRKSILREVDDSLKRLKTDYLDLYQIHCWDSGTPLEETLATLNDLIRCGKVRYLGGSNLSGWQMQKIVDVSQSHGYSQFVSLQQQYSILERHSELEAFEVCRNEGIGILPWSPLKGGWLTGKFKRDAPPDANTRTAQAGYSGRILESTPVFDKYKNDDKFWKINDELIRLAAKYGKSVAQVSLRWLLQKPNVTSVIVGVRTVKQLEDNMGAGSDWTLDPSDMQIIDKLSAVNLTYPYITIEESNANRRRSNCPDGRQF